MQNNLQWLRTANRIHTSKKTYTDTSLTIANTVNAPVEKLTIDGASSQTVTVQGKNLFDGTLESGTILPSDGTNATDSTFVRSKNKIKINPSTQYILSNNKGIVSQRVFYYDINGLFISVGEIGISSFITPANAYLIRFRVLGTDLSMLFQLELGSVATAYAPFIPDSPSPSYPATITNIVNPVVTVNSANLVQNGNFANGVTGWLSSNTSSFVANNGIASTTGNDIGFEAYLIQTTNHNILPNHKYYIKANMKVLNSNATGLILRIRSSTGNGDSGNITVQSNPIENQSYTKSVILTTASNWSGFLQFRCAHVYVDAATKNGKVMEVQNVIAIDMGIDSSNPLYNLTIAQMDTLFANWSDYKSTATNLIATLRNLPNGVKDKLVIDKTNQTAWIERNIGSVVFNGSESWALSLASGIGISFWTGYPTNCKKPIAPNYTPVDICSHFKQMVPMNVANQLVAINAGTSEGYAGIYDNTGLFAVMKTSIAANVTAWKTWLAGNNVTVQYQLATPTTESITYPSLSTIQYLTNISKSGIASSMAVDVLVLGN